VGGGGGSGGGYGFMTGPLAFTVQRASAYFKMTADGGADISRGAIFIADQPIGCPPALGPVLADAHLFMLDGTCLNPGGTRTYQVYDLLPNCPVLMVEKFADGGNRLYARGISGSFAFTSMSLATGISGNFDVTLISDGGSTSLSGSFEGPFCALY